MTTRKANSTKRATAKWLKSVLRLEHLPQQGFKAELSAFIPLLNPHSRQQNAIISAHTYSVTYFSSTAVVVCVLSTESLICCLLSSPCWLAELHEIWKILKNKADGEWITCLLQSNYNEMRIIRSVTALLTVQGPVYHFSFLKTVLCLSCYGETGNKTQF